MDSITPTQPVTSPAAEPIKPFPIQPGDIWDAAPGKTRVVIWQVENEKCQFWRGAVQLGLRRIQRGRVWFVKTSLEEMARLLIWSWDNK